MLTVAELASHGHPGSFASATHTHDSSTLAALVDIGNNGLYVDDVGGATWLSNKLWTNGAGWISQSAGGVMGSASTKVVGTTTGPSATATSANTGGGVAHNNMPPALITNYLIKL